MVNDLFYTLLFPRYIAYSRLACFISTAEAVLQKMDDMTKLRRRRLMDLDDLEEFHDAEVNAYSDYIYIFIVE